MTDGAAVAKLHDGEVDIDADLVARLLRAQFPALATRELRPAPTTGTVNAIFRLGDDLSVRLPRGERWVASLERELTVLPQLAGATTLQIPEPVERGQASDEYPLPWAIYRWIDGEPYGDDRIDDEACAAADLAAFIRELRRVDAAEAPPAGRRPLAELDEATVAALDAADGLIDAAGAHRAWAAAREAPEWDGRRTRIHADLLRPNLLVDDGGRLRAVLDFGGSGAGDPAADVVAAWAVFGPEGRAALRTELDVDEATWARARGYALHQAALIIPYYRETHPAFAATAVRTIEQVLLADRGRV